VLLPVYLHLSGLTHPQGAALQGLLVQGTVGLEALYILFIAFMMISRIPTYAGKTLGSRVPRSAVIPLFIVVVAFVALLATMMFEMLALLTVAYLACIPLMVRRYRQLAAEEARGAAAGTDV